MKKLIFLIAVLLVFLFSSCVNDSDWKRMVIPVGQEMLFSKPDSNGERAVIVLLNYDTMFVTNRSLLYRICYLRLAFPEKDITIDYLRINKGGRISFDPRFINLKK